MLSRMMTPRVWFPSLALLSLTLALSFSSDAAPGKSLLRMETTGSSFKVFVYKRGVASAFAHDHIIGVSDFKGMVTFDSDDPTKSHVALVVESASLQVLDSELSEKDKGEVKSNMDRDVLEVEKHPKIRFSSKKVELTERKAATAEKAETLTLKVTGELDLHGEKKSITLPVNIEVKDGEVIAKGATDLTQSEWGIKPYTAFLGAVGVKDLVKIEFTIVSKSR